MHVKKVHLKECNLILIICNLKVIEINRQYTILEHRQKYN